MTPRCMNSTHMLLCDLEPHVREDLDELDGKLPGGGSSRKLWTFTFLKP